MFIEYFVRQLSQGIYKKVTYIRMRKFMIQKRKSLFIPMKVQLIIISSVIPYISEINSTSSSLKKKKPQERKREREREEERMQKEMKKRWKKKGEGEGKRGRETEKEGEGEERSKREKRGENRESDTKSVSPSPDTFPSTKLGNNITSIKGELGKKTTPTGRGPSELNQNPYADPPRGRPSLDSSSFQLRPKREEGSKYELHTGDIAIYMKAEALGKLHIRFQFSMNQN